MFPNDKDVINESLPQKRLLMIVVYILFLKPTHEGVGICGRYFCAVPPTWR